MGRILSNTKLLEKAGWEVANLNTSTLNNFHNEKNLIALVGKFLQKHGVETEWKLGAKLADRLFLSPSSVSFYYITFLMNENFH